MKSIFTEITLALMAQSPHFMVNTTNDAWFGTTAAPYQHWAQVVVRAVESGRATSSRATTRAGHVVHHTYCAAI